MRSVAGQFFLLASFSLLANAEVRLPHMLSSHMVLQRDMPIHIWGWSNPGEKVTASINGASASATGDRLGHWNIYLPPLKAGGPYQVRISGFVSRFARASGTHLGSTDFIFDDVLIGDVWFASGQSNMEMPLNGFPGNAVVAHSAEEIGAANHSNMRLLLIKKKAIDYPQQDFDTSWTTCTPETAAKFSAVAYFFGRRIAEDENVPVGLIDSTWGGTPAESWISLNGLSSDAGLMPVFAERAEMIDSQADTEAIIEAEKREDAAAKAANQKPQPHAWRPDPASWGPAALYNGMVAPAIDYPIKGVIWYQGESNGTKSRAPLYEKVFAALIADWRTHWRQGNFPFFFVQIANYAPADKTAWPIVREAQRRTLAVANTGMAVTIDIGNPDNIHPADKQDVGARLALAARAVAYGEKLEYSGPSFRSTSTEEAGVRVWFDHANGLVGKNGPLQSFEIAGDDRQFLPAEAKIDGESVLVSNAQITNPKYVRYAWSSAPVASLFNSAGLPASPFTSEETIPLLN